MALARFSLPCTPPFPGTGTALESGREGGRLRPVPWGVDVR